MELQGDQSLSIKRALLLLTLVAFANLSRTVSCQSDKVVKVVLTRTKTENAGLNGQPVTNYYAPINIGTPAKTFNVQFDTDLEGSFVPRFDKFAKNTNLHHGKGYHCDSSTTCVDENQAFIFAHQQCILKGHVYKDTMSFKYGRSGRGANLGPTVTWPNKFLAVEEAKEQNFKYLPIDGFLSLAARTNNTPGNLLVGLHEAKMVDDLKFSLWFGAGSEPSPFGGELTLGGFGDRLQVQVHMHNVSKSNHLEGWPLNLQHVGLNNEVVSCDGKQCQAILSSGLDEIFGPLDDVLHIYALLNLTSHNNLQLVDCRKRDELPTLKFNIDGRQYALSPKQYVREIAYGGIFEDQTCYVAIQASRNGQKHQWVLGTNFLEAYYSMFDMANGQVGLASLYE